MNSELKALCEKHGALLRDWDSATAGQMTTAEFKLTELESLISDICQEKDARIAMLEKTVTDLYSAYPEFTELSAALKESDGWLEYLNPSALPDDAHRKAFDAFAWKVESILVGTSSQLTEYQEAERKRIRNEVLESAADWFETAPVDYAFEVRDKLRAMKE